MNENGIENAGYDQESAFSSATVKIITRILARLEDASMKAEVRIERLEAKFDYLVRQLEKAAERD